MNMQNRKENQKKQHYCPIHKIPLILMYGCGWDYDRLLCPAKIGRFSHCQYEIELETTTYPPEEKEKDV